MPSSGGDGWVDDVLGGLSDHERNRSQSRYERGEVLGSGGMAVVYRAIDRQLNRPVALKIVREDVTLSATLLRRFQREAESAARLSHPNLVAVHDVGELDGRPFIVMELVEGTDLAAALIAEEMPLERKVDLVRKIAWALDHAHQHGVIHRDLKPGNIILGAKGEPRVTDFGLAHVLHQPDRLTRTGTQIGTPLYMAPEQVEGEPGKVDARTDVWALGVILYEAITGQVPFSGDTVARVFRRITSADPAPPRRLNPEISADLETVCLHAMERVPARRYESAAAMARDLERCLAGEPIRARPIGPFTRLARKAKRNRLWVAAVLLAFGAGLGWAVLRSGPADDPERKALTGELEKERRRREASEKLAPAKRILEEATIALYSPAADAADLRDLAGKGIKACGVSLAIDGDFAEALHLRGRFHALAGDYEAALRDFGDAIDRGFPAAHLDRGELMLNRFFEISQMPWARRDGNRLRFKAGTLLEDGIADIRKALGPASGLGEEKLAHAEALRAVLLKETDAAEKCDAYIARARNKEKGYFLLALAKLKEDPARAERLLDDAIRWREKYPEAWHLRGVAKSFQGRARSAVDDFRRAVELRPGDVYSRNAAGYLFCDAGMLDEAETVLEEARAADPEFAGTYVTLGAIAARRGDVDRALELFDECLRLDPGQHLAVVNRGHAFHRMKRYDEALKEYQKAIEMAPDEACGYSGRGFARMAMGERAEAREDFRAALDRDPKCADALHGMGRTASSMEEAVGWFSRAIEAAPLHVPALHDRASALARMKEFDEALDDLKTVLELDPDHASALCTKGTVHFEQGDYDAAEKDLDRAVTLDPDNPIAWWMRSAVYLRTNRLREAAADLEKVVALDKGNLGKRAASVLPKIRRQLGDE